MGLLDLFRDGASDGSAPLLGRAQAVSGLLAPQPAISPAQQKWMDALGVISAGLSDAGAWLQHQPQAAYHVAALARRHAGLETPQDISAITARLPAMITTALLLNAARQGQSPQPANGAHPSGYQAPE